MYPFGAAWRASGSDGMEDYDGTREKKATKAEIADVSMHDCRICNHRGNHHKIITTSTNGKRDVFWLCDKHYEAEFMLAGYVPFCNECGTAELLDKYNCILSDGNHIFWLCKSCGYKIVSLPVIGGFCTRSEAVIGYLRKKLSHNVCYTVDADISKFVRMNAKAIESLERHIKGNRLINLSSHGGQNGPEDIMEPGGIVFEKDNWKSSRFVMTKWQRRFQAMKDWAKLFLGMQLGVSLVFVVGVAIHYSVEAAIHHEIQVECPNCNNPFAQVSVPDGEVYEGQAVECSKCVVGLIITGKSVGEDGLQAHRKACVSCYEYPVWQAKIAPSLTLKAE